MAYGGPELAGDYAQTLNDVDAFNLHHALVNDPQLKDYLVKPLWYDYENQRMRVGFKQGE